MTKLEDIRNTFEEYEAVGESWSDHFAVILPLVELSGEDEESGAAAPHILYEVRARKLDRQPGEVCFPGGQIEKGETPLESALRETEEELGICRDDIDIIARLGSICTKAGSHIHCFVGIVSSEAFAEMDISRAEVDEIFTVSVDDLLAAEEEVYWNDLTEVPDPDFPYDRVTGGEMYKWRAGRVPVPVYEVNGRIIWGLTGRMTKEFLEVMRCSD